MEFSKLRALVLVVSLGAAASAGAQMFSVTPAGSSNSVQGPATDTQTQSYASNQASVRQELPAPAIDPSADAKCAGLMANEYWDCVRSHNGGGGQ